MTALTLFADAADLELKVRSRDPEESWAAAVITAEAQMDVKDQILLILARKGPQTDDQIFDAYKQSGGNRTPQRVRTARKELVWPKVGEALVRKASVGVSNFENPSACWELI